MKIAETNEWMVLNSIIYKIYTTENSRLMRQQFLEQMKMVLDFDSADFYIASDREDGKMVEPVMYNCEENLSKEYAELPYNREIIESGRCLVCRATDMMSEEERKKSEYYQKVCRANNWHYSLQLIIGKDKKFLGIINFYRTIGKNNFQYEDIFLLDMLKDHIAYRLERDQSTHFAPGEQKLTVTQAAEQYELTRREQMILRLLMQGLDNNQLCDELSISVNTLKKHILNIYRKLGIRNRVQMFKMIRERE